MTTQRRHYEIVEEPRGAVYRGLLSALAPLCPLVLFTLPPRQQASPLARTVLAQLSEEILEVRLSTSGPGTGFGAKYAGLEEAPEVVARYGAEVYSLRLTERVLHVLLTVAEGLYDWHFPELPENLCLLRPERQACLWSAVPDRFAYLYVTDAEMRAILKQVRGVRVERVPAEEEWEEPVWWTDADPARS